MVGCIVSSSSDSIQSILLPSSYRWDAGINSSEILPSTPSTVPPLVFEIRATGEPEEVNTILAPASRRDGDLLDTGELDHNCV